MWTISIEIEGDTDYTGLEKLNIRLLHQRAESLKNALVKHFGIAASCLNTNDDRSPAPLSTTTPLKGGRKTVAWSSRSFLKGE